MGKRTPIVVPAPAEAAIGATQASPIAERGELAILLEGEPYTLRPSFAAIGRIETATGKTLWELTQAASGTSLSLVHAAEIITQCIRAHGEATSQTHLTMFKPDRVGALIYASSGGLLQVIDKTLRPLLLLAISGGFTALGERKPETN